jgi:hypothetical protein
MTKVARSLAWTSQVMAELIGIVASGLTIAAVFKTCIDSFDLILAHRKQDVEHRKLHLKLTIEKCRMYCWGVRVGIIDGNGNDTSAALDEYQFKEVVCKGLETIRGLFVN